MTHLFSNNVIQFENTGNITLTLVGGEVCKNDSDCKPLTSFRIYPTKKEDISIPEGYESGKINYTQKSAVGVKNIIIQS